MTSAHGNYTSCGFGQGFAFSISCVGPSCAALQIFPTLKCVNSTNNALHCANDVTCSGNSNFTSSFIISQTTPNVSVLQSADIYGNQVQLSANVTDNFSTANETSTTSSPTSTSGSHTSTFELPTSSTPLLTPSSPTSTPKSQATSSRQVRSSAFFAVLILFALFVVPASCTLCIPGTSFIPAALPSFMVAEIRPIVSATCTANMNQIQQLIQQAPLLAPATAIQLTTDCQNEAISIQFPSSPVPKQLQQFALGPAIIMFCNKMAEAIVEAVVEGFITQSTANLCDQVASAFAGTLTCGTTTSSTSSQSTTTASNSPSSSQATSNSASSPTSVPSPTSSGSPTSSASPSSSPKVISALSLPAGSTSNSCVVCWLNRYFLGLHKAVPAECGRTLTIFSNDDLAPTFCNPAVAEYASYCTSLCSNVCTFYSYQSIKDALGSQDFIEDSDPYGSGLGQICNQCLDWVTTPYYTCDFANNQAPSCICGAGLASCCG